MEKHQEEFSFVDRDLIFKPIWPIEKQKGNWSDDFGEFLREGTRYSKRPKVLSLFSGAGGLDIGFHDCGFEILETVEFEGKFVETLNANSGIQGYFGRDVKSNCCDIRDFFPNNYDVDFIIGGPPCQPFSAAGARASGVSGTKDSRGTLFMEYVRLLKTLKPKGFLFENVYRIVGANSGRDWVEIVREFESAGYALNYRVLNSADYGVAQLRERLIIVGINNEFAGEIEYNFPRPTHGPDSIGRVERFSAGHAIFDISSPELSPGLKGRYGHLLEGIPPGLNYSFYTEKLGHPEPVFAWRSKFSDFLYKADPERPVRTIKAQGGQYTGPFHWDSRPFSLAELKRLQSFPDSYKIAGSRVTAIQQLGNSVPPQFARVLAASVAEQIFGAKLPISLEYIKPNYQLSFPAEKRLLTKYYEELAVKANRQRRIPCISDFKLIKKYISRLGKDHSWVISTNEVGTHEVGERIEDESLRISVKSWLADGEDGGGWRFVITPQLKWSLPISKIIIESLDNSLNGVQAAWKALEYFLIRNSLKADLVQLFNYYQYRPSAFIRCEKAPDGLDGKLISLLCERDFVAKEFSIDRLSVSMGISDEESKLYLMRLKENGFEVRSSGTNPAIQDGLYLIPYAFPTLTPMSIQRRKELFS